MKLGFILRMALLWCCVTVPAFAHKVKCFAAAEGDAVSGYAWMGGGERPHGVPYRVVSSQGEVLFEGRTGERGEFLFVPARPIDHEIIVAAGEGHEARFVVRAVDLPAGVRPAAPAAGAAGLAPAEPPAGRADTVPVVPWDAIVARAVTREVAPLRRELAEFREQRRMQDLVAGLGYIAGIAGFAFFWLGRRPQAGRRG